MTEQELKIQLLEAKILLVQASVVLLAHKGYHELLAKIDKFFDEVGRG